MRLKAAWLALLLALLAGAAPAAAQMPGGAPQAPPGALHRYYSALDRHALGHARRRSPATTPSSSRSASCTPPPGPGRTAIYGCRAGAADYFLSPDAGLRGQTPLGIYGWVDNDARGRPLGAAVPLPATGHRRTSPRNDAGCEGQTTEGRLGYMRARQPALARYSTAPDHWVTHGHRGRAATRSRPCSASCCDEGGREPPGAVRVRASGGDRFLSLDPGCEGQHRARASRATCTPRRRPDEDVVAALPLPRRQRPLRLHRPELRGPGDRGPARLPAAHAGAAPPRLQPVDEHALGDDGRDRAGLVPRVRRSATCSRATAATAQPLYGCLRGHRRPLPLARPGLRGPATRARPRAAGSTPRRPPGVATAPLYRCLRPGIGHFASIDPACEGQRDRAAARLRCAPTAPSRRPPPLRLTCAPSAATRDRVAARPHGAPRPLRRPVARSRGRVPQRRRQRRRRAPVLILIGDRKPIVFARRCRARRRYRVRVRPGKNRILHAGFRPAPESSTSPAAAACASTSAPA